MFSRRVVSRRCHTNGRRVMSMCTPRRSCRSTHIYGTRILTVTDNITRRTIGRRFFRSKETKKTKTLTTSESEKAKKDAIRRQMQVNYMRNPPTMLKIFNPELYMDPKNSRTWTIVGGAWVIVFTTLGLMYLKESLEEKANPSTKKKKKKKGRGSGDTNGDYECKETW